MPSETVEISDIWLRNRDGKLEVLAEVSGVFRIVITENDPCPEEHAISHMVTPNGIRQSPVDDLMMIEAVEGYVASNYLQLGDTKAVREHACLLRAEAPQLGHFTPDMLDALADEVDRLQRQMVEIRKRLRAN